MTRVARALILGLLVPAFTRQTVHAGCVEQAAGELHPGTPVTVLRTDGTTTQASFRSAEGDPLRLVLDVQEPHSQRAPQRLELPAAEVARLDAPPRARFNSSRFALSILVGAGVGALVGALVPADRATIPPWVPSASGGYGVEASTTDRWPKVAQGAAIGAASGAVLGVFLGATHDPPRTWACLDPASEPSEATPDSTQVPIR